MVSGFTAVNRAAPRDVLAHECSGHRSRRWKIFCGLTCLWLASLGTVSTVAAWQDPAAHRIAVTGEAPSERGGLTQPPHDALDLLAFRQLAGH